MSNALRVWCFTVLVLTFPALVGGQCVPVQLVESEGGWALHRHGQVYRVRGAGGTAPLDRLAAFGGNSTRVWGFDQLEDGRLDEADRHNITVAVGMWLRHDLNYDDLQQVESQIEMALDGVRKYKDHRAVLLWGIGNEMEGELGENLAVWHHVEEIAKRIKALDPHHPTMTVLAELGGDKVKHLHRLCPSIDIVGINSYGGAATVPRRYRDAGGTKPYILTEFGPRGSWELERNALDSVDEELPQVKAETYAATYEAVEADQSLCLGSYAFMWGNKQELTPTWFGMLLPDGRKTAAVDVMTRLWTGVAAENLCPQIDSLEIEQGILLSANQEFTVRLRAHDPEQQPLQVAWVLMEDAREYVTAGAFQAEPPQHNERIMHSTATKARIRAPEEAGLYRVFAYVGDGVGAAYANVVFRVEE